MLETIKASAPPEELLAADETAPLMRLAAHPVWDAALTGTLAKETLCRLVTLFYPAIGGPGRYIFAGKVSQIAREDGEALFLQLYNANNNPEADTDRGWRVMAEALGVPAATLEAELARPSPEAQDYVATVRDHGLRSSPAEAAMVAWAIERQLPALWGALADSLAQSYGLAPETLTYLRYEASRNDQVAKWVRQLIETYVLPGDAYRVFEARRAAREAVWAWTALTEAAQ